MAPKPVCVKCQLELKTERIGISVIEMAYNPPQPYRIWNADISKCRGCGVELVTGYAGCATEHFEPDFEIVLQSALSREHVFCYEKLSLVPA